MQIFSWIALVGAATLAQAGPSDVPPWAPVSMEFEGELFPADGPYEAFAVLTGLPAPTPLAALQDYCETALPAPLVRTVEGRGYAIEDGTTPLRSGVMTAARLPSGVSYVERRVDGSGSNEADVSAPFDGEVVRFEAFPSGAAECAWHESNAAALQLPTIRERCVQPRVVHDFTAPIYLAERRGGVVPSAYGMIVTLTLNDVVERRTGERVAGRSELEVFTHEGKHGRTRSLAKCTKSGGGIADVLREPQQ